MPGANADLVRTVYGFNWAAIGERERGLEAAAKIIPQDAVARVALKSATAFSMG